MHRDCRIAFAGLYENDFSRLMTAPANLSAAERLMAAAVYETLLRRAMHFDDAALPLPADDPLAVVTETAMLSGIGSDAASRILAFLHDQKFVAADAKAGRLTFPEAPMHGGIVKPAALRNRRYRRRQKEQAAHAQS